MNWNIKNLTSFKRPAPYLLLALSLVVFSLLLFARLVHGLLGDSLTEFDQLFSSIIISWRTEPLTPYMIALTKSGNTGFMVPAAFALGLLFIFKFRQVWEVVTFWVALLGGWGVLEPLKLVFQRARPSGIPLVEAVGYSFPSGHAMLATVFYGYLIYIFWLKVKNPYARLAATVLLSMIALGVGSSRVYVGVHYPSDVLAGFAAGVFWLVSCILAFQWLRYYRQRV